MLCHLIANGNGGVVPLNDVRLAQRTRRYSGEPLEDAVGVELVPAGQTSQTIAPFVLAQADDAPAKISNF